MNGCFLHRQLLIKPNILPLGLVNEGKIIPGIVFTWLVKDLFTFLWLPVVYRPVYTVYVKQGKYGKLNELQA